MFGSCSCIAPWFSPLLPLLLSPSILGQKIIDTPYPIEVDTPYYSLSEYDVLDRELDTPYQMEVDTPYSAIDKNSPERLAQFDWVWKSIRYGVSKELDTAYWGFLRARIRRIFLIDMAYWSSE
ncbi:hypothetical protein Tco_1380522 [Tanacetum coccineum]